MGFNEFLKNELVIRSRLVKSLLASQDKYDRGETQNFLKDFKSTEAFYARYGPKVFQALREAYGLIRFHAEPGQRCPNCEEWIQTYDQEFSEGT